MNNKVNILVVSMLVACFLCNLVNAGIAITTVAPNECSARSKCVNGSCVRGCDFNGNGKDSGWCNVHMFFVCRNDASCTPHKCHICKTEESLKCRATI